VGDLSAIQVKSPDMELAFSISAQSKDKSTFYTRDFGKVSAPKAKALQVGPKDWSNLKDTSLELR
jgi:hypothetical protein